MRAEEAGVEIVCRTSCLQLKYPCLLGSPLCVKQVLLNILMPEMDGCAAARAIRHCGKPDAETIPILAMTANAFDDDRQKSLSAGMNDYLSKPLDIPKLTEAIQKFRTTSTDNGGLVG